MGEKKGALVALVIFISIIVPALLMFSIDALQQNAFGKVTAEIGEIIKEEGGVTQVVADTVNDFQRKGYVISLSDTSGNKLTTTVNWGEVVVADYAYTYTNMWKERELKTRNEIVILKRDSTGGGIIEEGGIVRTIDLTSDELTTDGNHVQTFQIPGLKKIKSFFTDNGSAQVVNTVGENVTIQMKNGTPTREEMVIDGEIEDTKYVDNQDGPYYDQDGYKGTLEKYVVSGEYVEGDSKMVTEQDSPYYEDDEGYSGELEEYFHGGNLLPEDTKEATDALQSEFDKTAQKRTVTELITSDENNFADSITYNKDGYKGEIGKKGNAVQRLIEGEYTPADTKYVENQNAENYNKDGYVGKLERYVVSGEYVPYAEKEIKDYLADISPPSPSAHHTFTHYYAQSGMESTRPQRFMKFPIQSTGGNVNRITHNYRDDEGFKGVLNYYDRTTTGIKDVQFDHANYLRKYYSDEVATEILNILNENNIYTHDDFLRVINGQHNTVITPKKKYQFIKQIEYSSNNFVFIHYPLNEIFPNLKLRFSGTVVRPVKDTRKYAYRGYVTKPESDTRVYEFDQLYEGVVEQDTDALFPDSIEYDEGGYKGTLFKDGEVMEHLVSGEYVPYDEKYVENEDDPNYDKDGYKGTLEKYVAKGEFIPEDNKEVLKSLEVPIDVKTVQESLEVPMDVKTIVEEVSSDDPNHTFAETIEYNKDGFVGTLTKKGEVVRNLVSGEYIPADSKEIIDYEVRAFDMLKNNLNDFGKFESYFLYDIHNVSYPEEVPMDASFISNYLSSLGGMALSYFYVKDGYIGSLIPPKENGNFVTATSFFRDYYRLEVANEVLQLLNANGFYTRTDIINYFKNNTEVNQLELRLDESSVYTFLNNSDYHNYRYTGISIVRNNNNLSLIVHVKGVGRVFPDHIFKVSGIVTRKEADTRKFEYIQQYEGEVVKIDGNNFPEVIEYDNDGYKGTLTKKGEPKKVVVSGEYVPADTKEISFTTNFSEEAGRVFDKARREGRNPGSGQVENHPTYTNPPNTVDLDTLPTGYEDYEGILTRTYIGVERKKVVWDLYTGRIGNPEFYTFTNNEWIPVYIGAGGTILSFNYKDTEGYSSANLGLYVLPGLTDKITYIPLDKPITVDSRLPNNDPNTSAYNPNYIPKEGDYATVAIYGSIYRFEGYAFLGGHNGAKWLYEGTVTRPAVDTRVYKYVQEYEGEVVKLEGKDLPETIEYDEDGYTGILVKDGERRKELVNGNQTISSSRTNTTKEFPDSIVENGITLYKTGDPVVEIITSENETKEISIEVEESDWSFKRNTPPLTYEYEEDGYVGILNANGNHDYLYRNVTNWRPSDPYAVMFYVANSSQISGDLESVQFDKRLEGESLPDFFKRTSLSDYINPEVVPNSWRWASDVDSKETSGAATIYWDEVPSTFNNRVQTWFSTWDYDNYEARRLYFFDYTFDYAKWKQTYSGTATKGTYQYRQEYSATITESDTPKYKYVQDYKGVVTRPESDTREYKYRGTVRRAESDTRQYEYVQEYRGMVTKPEEDTREYKYQGIVTKPTIDTREYKYRGNVVKPATPNSGETHKYYQYNFRIEYEAWE